MYSKSLSFFWNPLWWHCLAWATTALGVAVGIFRIVIDPTDWLRCGALISRGSWLDGNHRNWQPDGCMAHAYTPKDATSCLSSRRVFFIGDSVTRKLFFQFAHIADPSLPISPPDDDHKHSDHELSSTGDIQFSFHWDPFLNSSVTRTAISFTSWPPAHSHAKPFERKRPALLVLGSGLWYLRYSDSSGGLPRWEATIEATLDSITNTSSQAADEIVLLPVEEVVSSKLSRDRASTMRSSDIDAMNSDLLHRVASQSAKYVPFLSASHPPAPVSYAKVFNEMLDVSQTEDGLHYSDAIVRAQANVLLNLRCNNVLPKTFPFDKTCCRSYPRPSALHMAVIVCTVLWGPLVWVLSQRQGDGLGPPPPLISEDQIPPLIISGAIMLIYLADRTHFWLKEQKQFDPWVFGFLTFTALGVGLGTVKGAEKDLGFLNREQTDEWKGWMQIAILIYHYLGASKISGVYNPIRVLVAAYLFMSGYGHTTFYLKKADFGFSRVAQILVRLNLFTLLLAYAMNTDYISYYFAPLVSLWYLIIYATMAVGSKYNERTAFLIFKIVLSAGAVTWFMREPAFFETLFEFLRTFFAIRWSARECAFRINLDLYIVYVGMLAALSVIKIREHRLVDHPQWPLASKIAIAASGAIILWFFAFELYQESKFTYNAWHPYVSFLPILAFVTLRNANTVLRSGSSRAFTFIGRCSLETFTIQFHFWLAADTKGILLVLPGTRWRPLNFVLTSVIFVYISHRVALATSQITSWICGTKQQERLPTTAAPYIDPSSSASRQAHRAEETIPLSGVQFDGMSRKNGDRETIPPEPDTPIRPMRRWADRLAEGQHQQSEVPLLVWWGGKRWSAGVKIKLLVATLVMWVMNMMWTYPS